MTLNEAMKHAAEKWVAKELQVSKDYEVVAYVYAGGIEISIIRKSDLDVVANRILPHRPWMESDTVLAMLVRYSKDYSWSPLAERAAIAMDLMHEIAKPKEPVA